MKQIKSFVLQPDALGADINDLDKQVNSFINTLRNSGVTEVDIKVSNTNKFVIYTLIWYGKVG